MDKIKRRKAPRHKNERIGLNTGLLDRNRNEIKTGDRVTLSNVYEGVVLWHREYKEYGLFMGCWYGDKNPYSYDSYGKYIRIPKDNGMRMELEINGNIYLNKED